jgi:hypothetical protein
VTDDDDEPSRFDTLSHALLRAQRRAIRRFGYANCAHCGHEFIEHRRDQRKRAGFLRDTDSVRRAAGYPS